MVENGLPPTSNGWIEKARRSFDYGGDLARMREEIARFAPEDVAGYENLVEASRRIFDVGFSELAHRPFTRFGAMMAQLPALVRLRADRTVSALVAKHIRHPLLRRAFSIQPLLVGGNRSRPPRSIR